MAAEQDYVAPDEVLYRRVQNRKENYKLKNSGYKINSPAFGGSDDLQPSVDRAKLRGNNPENSKVNATDLIVSLVAQDVRTKTGSPRTIDVVSDPIKDDPELSDNPAHAVITAKPPFTSNNQEFRKFKKALARLARWEIPPPNPT